MTYTEAKKEAGRQPDPAEIRRAVEKAIEEGRRLGGTWRQEDANRPAPPQEPTKAAYHAL